MAKVCALCKVNGDLQRSHIIPEFFYKMVYEAQPRRLRVVSAEPSVPERYEQKGLRESLLCRACEQKVGLSKNFKIGAYAVEVKDFHGDLVAQFQGLVYRKKDKLAG
jgi:hypothetical protein